MKRELKRILWNATARSTKHFNSTWIWCRHYFHSLRTKYQLSSSHFNLLFRCNFYGRKNRCRFYRFFFDIILMDKNLKSFQPFFFDVISSYFLRGIFNKISTVSMYISNVSLIVEKMKQIWGTFWMYFLNNKIYRGRFNISLW